ncbi:hypothetical protein GCM10022215_17810 [Nocardioides fonticola]|uniref:Uncharacterized protein n=1 Tax=Nocardioides fonticola TaxID=450363 RepID=A0ABP7XI75_9ACTN
MTGDLNLDHIADLLTSTHGIGHVTILMTGGGVATLYVGPFVDDPDGGRSVIAAGPGTYRTEGPSTAHASDFYVGPDGDDETFVSPSPDATDEDVALLILTEYAKALAARDDLIDPWVNATIAEISDLIGDGTLPPDVADYSSLHDHIDANTLGGMCADGVVLDLGIVREVQDRVDRYLKTGSTHGIETPEDRRLAANGLAGARGKLAAHPALEWDVEEIGGGGVVVMIDQPDGVRVLSWEGDAFVVGTYPGATWWETGEPTEWEEFPTLDAAIAHLATSTTSAA